MGSSGIFIGASSSCRQQVSAAVDFDEIVDERLALGEL